MWDGDGAVHGEGGCADAAADQGEGPCDIADRGDMCAVAVCGVAVVGVDDADAEPDTPRYGVVITVSDGGGARTLGERGTPSGSAPRLSISSRLGPSPRSPRRSRAHAGLYTGGTSSNSSTAPPSSSCATWTGRWGRGRRSVSPCLSSAAMGCTGPAVIEAIVPVPRVALGRFVFVATGLGAVGEWPPAPTGRCCCDEGETIIGVWPCAESADDSPTVVTSGIPLGVSEVWQRITHSSGVCPGDEAASIAALFGGMALAVPFV